MATTRTIDVAACRPHPHLFQINTWVWLERLSREAGRMLRLVDVPDAQWDRIAADGFDLVYLLGIWRRSVAGRSLFRTDPAGFAVFDHALPEWTMDDVIGSPFSIAAYEPDPRIGDWSDVDTTRARLAARGMRLILDFVPNHLGPDHPWVTARPEYFIQGDLAEFRANPKAFILSEAADRPVRFVARGRDPYFPPWADTAQIDHYHPDARAALVEVLREIGRHCDGVRCDMAMLVLNEIFGRTWAHLLRGRAPPAGEFWDAAMGAVPPGFIWIAEAYWDTQTALRALGFDYIYDKRLYDCLVEAESEQTRQVLSADLEVQTHMARFIENHDERRAMDRVGRARLPSLTAAIATLPGLRFFHDGQFDGRTVHEPMPLDRVDDGPTDAALAATCRTILLIAADDVFHHGAWALAELSEAGDGTAGGLVAYTWHRGTELRLVVLNLREPPAQARVAVAGLLEDAGRHVFHDLLDGQVYVRDASDLARQGLYVKLDGYRAHVFSVTPVV